ncbi:MAG: leucine-rich repeat protein [Paludibacteraceae bacterium]|nr:leucine-rich repeat protein [Paludibacteraceae bacterium]
MKKILLFATTLLLSSFSFASEYVNDKYCIYKIDVGEQTAEVVNFYTEATSISIPASFMYQGDRYVVESIGAYDFANSYDSKYCYVDYAKIRANIVELTLPNTLKTIKLGAFDKMTRLKKITIPSKVQEFSASCLGDNSRLEEINIEGLPCFAYSYFDDSWNYKSVSACIENVDDPVAFLNDLKKILKGYKCPKLQKLEIVPLKNYLSYSNKLKDTIFVYETKLQKHPYYIESETGYFSNIKITIAKGADYKKDYSKQLTLCREKYQTLYKDMEQICKTNSPEIYAERYCTFNPDFSAQIDDMLKDYKCEYTKLSLAQAVLEEQTLKEKCQESLWKKYSYLYKSKEVFLNEYDNSSDINQAISTRTDLVKRLKQHILNNKMKTKGVYDSTKDSWIVSAFRKLCDEMKGQEIPFSKEIINQDAQAQKEFEKNGHYFSSADEFFSAYITNEYKNILKEKQKS